MHRFENTLERGSKRNSVHIILVWTVENGRKTHQNENDNQNIAGGCVCYPFVACAWNSIVFERFIRKRITTVVWTRIDRWVFYDNENAYFRKSISVDRA